MQPDITAITASTIAFVKQTLSGAEAGHDWFHIERVYKTALSIQERENGDLLTVTLAALLHDIADSKFNNGDEEAGPALAGEFMERLQLPAELILTVRQIIRNMSFKASLGTVTFRSLEMDIVQDADRLDAIGAIGIARAFHYGGYKNRALYDPSVMPVTDQDKEAYKQSAAPTINHFYEKLLRLKDLMNTGYGKTLALQRHDFMVAYLEQFYAEWEGKR